MNCVASAYNVSGKLVGCTEQDLFTIVSVQMYTVFALGTGLYMYKSFTAENWADIAIKIGWGGVSAFTRVKRVASKHLIPVICNAGSVIANHITTIMAPSADSDSEVSIEDDHCYVRVVKDGTELHGYSSLFGLIGHLAQHSVDEDSDDVVDVNLDENANENANAKLDSDLDLDAHAIDGHAIDATEDECIKEQLAQIENHCMKFDFVICQVPTLQTVTSDTPQCMHVIKYDGFPRTPDGLYFCDRKFVPVDHRMIEIVLQFAGAEYELNLSSPDNFYVLGNHLLDPAFMKWFMRKNHGVRIDANANNEYDYTIKCIDHDANMHTLLPCNYLHVTETGFEVHDSGLI